MRVLLGLPQVGSALKEIGRKTWRDLGSEDLLVERRPAGDGAGIAAQEQGDPILLRGDQALEVRDVGGGRGKRGLRARRFERGSGPRLEAPTEQIVRFAQGAGRPLRDVEKKIELPQLEVAQRDLGDQRECDALPRLLGRQILSPADSFRRRIRPQRSTSQEAPTET
jgi:hypothetical protein